VKRVVVLVSGSGTLLQALLDARAAGGLDADVVGVVSDKPDAYGLARARAANVPTAVLELAGDRAAWDAALAELVASFTPDLVVCAGFMRILGPAFLRRFAGRTINSHPSLLPSFPGAHAVRDALAHGVKVTGATVFVVDDGVDTGPILAQEAVFVAEGESQEDLHERIKVMERRMLVRLVNEWRTE